MIIKRKWLTTCCVALAWWAASVNAAVLEHRHVQDVLAWLGNYQPQALHDGKRLAFPALIEALDTHRVVFVGETHDRYDHHLNQLAILQALHRRNPQVAIGVEWFQQPFQPVVDAWLAGKIDEAELLRRTEYFDRWRYDYRMLRPIMEYAKANGLPVMALNAPTELTRKVAQGGLEALSSSQRAQLPASISPPDPAYRSRLEKVFAQHAGAQHQLDNFMLVQRVWDETMAQNVIRFLQPNPQWCMVVFSGSGHISHGAGIPQDVTQQRADISVTTVASSDESDVQAETVDYYLLTKPLALPATGRLGVKLNTAPNAVTIGAMLENSAAQRAGLQTNDRITAIDALSVTSMSDLMLALARYKPGQQAQVTVQRQGVADLAAYNVVLQ